jgi:hypothetical protein
MHMANMPASSCCFLCFVQLLPADVLLTPWVAAVCCFLSTSAGKEYGKDASQEAYAALMQSGLTFIDTAEVRAVAKRIALYPIAYIKQQNSRPGEALGRWR